MSCYMDSIDLFDFQERAVLKLLELTSCSKKQVITVKAPTGSGKTIILLKFIDNYLFSSSKKTAFIWLCPGRGDLEEQSRRKMLRLLKNRRAQNLTEALAEGFSDGSTTFINWELVTKIGNKAVAEGERKNLFDCIKDAHRNKINFIIIIDEEHSNNTYKAQNVIDVFSADFIIRMSATASKNSRYEFYEIDEHDVIDSGLITKAIYVNEGMQSSQEIGNDYDYLLDLADKKRKEILQNYILIERNINPLVLIQFPNGYPDTIAQVEKKLEEMGYTYGNGMVSKWMSEDRRDLPDNLTDNDASPAFLLMKQAISTGWDCPRAKILVKLREGMNEQFEIQTIGRIRRMPEARHYDDDLLDFCFVYTFDKKWKDGLLKCLDKAYEMRRLILKEKCRGFTLKKQMRNLDLCMVGEREVLEKVYSYFVNKYHLSADKAQNMRILQESGYIFRDTLSSEILHGEYVLTEAVGEKNAEHVSVYRKVDTHLHGIDLLHSVDILKSVLGLSSEKMKLVLERLFRTERNLPKKIVALDTKDFYAFIINNLKKLKGDFEKITANVVKQLPLTYYEPKLTSFHLPEQDFFRYDPSVKSEIAYSLNAYEDYTSGFNTLLLRSIPEQLFERFCENNNNVDWFYKNGDTGKQYFSIVYLDALNKQWLFYPDYIVRMRDGTIWIIEAKGGQVLNRSKNIDIQIENKFNAFKLYAEKFSLNWGFVRDMDNNLYINNTEFVLDMNDSHWRPIKELL